MNDNSNADCDKNHIEIIDDVFKATDEQIELQMQKLRDEFLKQSFTVDKADEIMRDDFLDRYFKGTYIEWGIRQFLEKAKTNNMSLTDSHDPVDDLIASFTKPIVAPI